MGPLRRLLGRLVGTIGCLLILALIVAVVGGFAAIQLFAERVEVAPADAVRNFLRAYDDEDPGRMHEIVSEDLKRRYPPERLRIRMEQALDEIGGHLGSWNVDDVPYPREEGAVGIYFEAEGSRLSPRRFQVHVIREGDRWRISRLPDLRS